MPVFKVIIHDTSRIKLVGPGSECATLEAAVQIAKRRYANSWKSIVVEGIGITIEREVVNDPHWLFKIAESLDHQNLDSLFNDPPTFACIEYSSGFAVRHLPSGKEHWMSDGVDVLTDAEDRSISPGTPDFTALWSEALNETGSDTLEAYFPELVEDD